MSKHFTYYLTLPLILLAVALSACEETEEVGRYDNWRARNEAFIDSLENVYATQTDGHLRRFELFSAPGEYIYYTEKTPVESSAQNKSPEIYGKRPTTGSTVTIYYKGSNILNERFDGFYGEDPNVDQPGSSNPNVNEGETVPTELALSDLITGWKETLQRMTVGERWEVYIPWQYGYGSSDQEDSSGNTSILAYSTLIFDIQLLDADYVAE